ncbi:hypothetical protein [Mycolicibacterium fortuitum]|nr:hypothetical protein [Mycolicibacterium fortuitum]
MKHGKLEVEHNDIDAGTSYQPLHVALGQRAAKLEAAPITAQAPEFFK